MTPELARELHPAVPAARVVEAVTLVWREYRREAKRGEPLAAFVAREEERLRAKTHNLLAPLNPVGKEAAAPAREQALRR